MEPCFAATCDFSNSAMKVSQVQGPKTAAKDSCRKTWKMHSFSKWLAFAAVYTVAGLRLKGVSSAGFVEIWDWAGGCLLDS